jgi:phage gpG-like protein
VISIDITLTRSQLQSLSKRLDGLVRRTRNLGPFFDDASAYMVNVVQHRILRSKRSPSGERWPALSEATIDIKGHGTILFQTGALARSISVDATDTSGFVITADAEYAGYMQNGVSRTGGMIPGKRIPPRPFMGISDTNVKVISKMLKDYVAGRAISDPGYGEAG